MSDLLIGTPLASPETKTHMGLYSGVCEMRRNLFAAAVLAIGSLCAAAPASAVVINDTNDDFTVNFSQAINGGITVRGSAAFNVFGVTDSYIDLQVSLNNLTDTGAPSGWKGGWASIGWASNPDILGYSWWYQGSRFDSISGDDIPSLNAVEICFFAGNNCNGGSQNSLLADGASDSFAVRLYSRPNNNINWIFDNFGAKFQTDSGSYEFYGCTGSCNTTSVPEPGSLALLGLGLAGLGAAVRRRKAA